MLSKALVEMALGLPNVLFAAFFVFKIEGLCCKPKSRANIIHHFIFVSFFFFIISITLPAVTISLLFYL